MNVVDHSNNDFVEVGRVNGGVSLTEMRVDEEEVIVGKKDGIPFTTSSEGRSAKIFCVQKDTSIPSTASEDSTPIQNKTLTKEDSVTSTASSDNQYTEIMFVVKEAMKAKAKDGVRPTKMIGVKDVIVGKEILLASEV
jgi:hypothetical protein